MKKLFLILCVILVLCFPAYSTNVPSYFSTGSSFSASGVISTTPNISILNIICYNSSASTIFLFIFDSTTVPIDGSGIPNGTAGFFIPVASTTEISLDISPRGRVFMNGIAYAVSTTAPTKTLGTAVISLFVVYG